MNGFAFVSAPALWQRLTAVDGMRAFDNIDPWLHVRQSICALPGSGRRLDGKSVAVALPPAPPSAAGPSSRASQGLSASKAASATSNATPRLHVEPLQERWSIAWQAVSHECKSVPLSSNTFKLLKFPMG